MNSWELQGQSIARQRQCQDRYSLAMALHCRALNCRALYRLGRVKSGDGMAKLSSGMVKQCLVR